MKPWAFVRRIVCCGCLILTSGITVVPAAAAVPGSTLRWTDCGNRFQCATLQVPLDYKQPTSSTISLAAIRLPATNPATRIGSLFMNPGGPGLQGTDFLRAEGNSLPPELRARFDLISFDPRGVGNSTSVHCFSNGREQDQFFANIPPFPLDPNQQTTFFRTFAAFGQRCAQRNSALLPHMSTANAARDMDLLRAAVGDTQLNYLGLSYGTFLGTTYANLFPNRVRTMILDGAMDPVEWTTGRVNDSSLPFTTRLKGGIGTWRALNSFFALCTQAGQQRCSFAAATPTATRAKFDNLMTRLRQQPVVLRHNGGNTETVTYPVAIDTIKDQLEEPGEWPSLASTLQSEFQVSQGTRTAGNRNNRLSLAAPPPNAQGYPNFQDANAAVECADSTNPRTSSAWEAAAKESDQKLPYFGADWTYLGIPCAQWPVQDADRYIGPWNRQTSNPVLVVGNIYDPNTPYENAVSLSRELANARLLTLNGWGHTAFGQSACVMSLETRYLVNITPPTAGTVCQPDHVPFGLPSSKAPSTNVTNPPPST